MDITTDEFKTLCDDIDVGGMSRELSSHHEMYKIVEFVASNQKCLPVVISCVNKYLAVADDRNKGFQILHIVLRYLPISLVEEKAIIWSNFALEFNRCDANSERLLVLAKLIDICSANQNSDFNKHITNGGLFKRIIDKCQSLQSLLKSGLSIHYAIVHLLNVCLQNYPGSCGNHKSQIETFLIKYLDIPNKEGVIEEAGTCLHYLQQVGQAGPNHINYITNWCNHLKKMCATIHELYDHLFEDDIELNDVDKPTIEGYKFEHMNSCDSLNTAMLNGRRLLGLLKFLEEMFRNPYPVEKQIHSSIILGVIQRILSIRLNEANKNMIDNYNSHWILQIKLNVLHVLKHWINIMGRQSTMFQPIIFNMLINSMNEIEKSTTIYSDYQLKLYNVFAFYISRAKPTLSKKINEQLIQHFLKYIKPIKTNVELNIDISIVGKTAKGKKRSIDQRIIDSGRSLKNQQEADADKETREKICVGSLKALNKLFESIHVKIGEKTCIHIFGTIIPILNDLHENTAKIPYDSENCQVEVYNFLLRLYDQPFLPCHLPLSLGIMYFNGAQNKNTERIKVTETCEKAMYILEKTCQPMCATLYEPGRYANYENERNSDENNRREESEVNFAFNNNNDADDEIMKESNNEKCIEKSFSEDTDEENLETLRYSPISQSGSNPKSAATVKKVRILTETVIPSPTSTTKSNTDKAATTSPNCDNTSSLTGDTGELTAPNQIIFLPYNSSYEMVTPPKPIDENLVENETDQVFFIEIKDENQTGPCTKAVKKIIESPAPSVVEVQQENDMVIVKDDYSIFSKETLLLSTDEQNAAEGAEVVNKEDMDNCFVPDTNF